jgi:hypothetical protein
MVGYVLHIFITHQAYGARKRSSLEAWKCKVIQICDTGQRVSSSNLKAPADLRRLPAPHDLASPQSSLFERMTIVNPSDLWLVLRPPFLIMDFVDFAHRAAGEDEYL